jgi:protein phosphatase
MPAEDRAMDLPLEVHAATDRGRKRAENEDSHAIWIPDHAERDRRGVLLVVADGMGGTQAGAVASRLAVETVLREYRRGDPTEPGRLLRDAVVHANREVHERSRNRADCCGMGTTLTALAIHGRRVWLAHVGDSRAYLVRGDRIRQLTDDHSLVGELVRRREISADAAREHPQRHVLTRAVGVRPQVEPDLAELSPEADDAFVLCSDGLTGHVRDEEIAGAVASGTDPQEAVDHLIALANSRGGEDNITVVIVRCEKSGSSG